jgi:hypothetical protein
MCGWRSRRGVGWARGEAKTRESRKEALPSPARAWLFREISGAVQAKVFEPYCAPLASERTPFSLWERESRSIVAGVPLQRP